MSQLCVCVFNKKDGQQEEGRVLVSYVNKHLGYKINEFTLLTIINFSIYLKKNAQCGFSNCEVLSTQLLWIYGLLREVSQVEKEEEEEEEEKLLNFAVVNVILKLLLSLISTFLIFRMEVRRILIYCVCLNEWRTRHWSWWRED